MYSNSKISCPSYPYHPRNGVFCNGNTWEYFCPSWFLPQPGNGTVAFKAQGNDIYIGLFEKMGVLKFQYAIIISGWSNTLIHLYKNGDWDNHIHEEYYQVNDTKSITEWAITFCKEDSSVNLRHNGKTVFHFKDSAYNASNASYISFSQYSNNVVIHEVEAMLPVLDAKMETKTTTDIDNIAKYPYIPRKGVFDGAPWEKFHPEWKLPTPGTGLIFFTAKGNDIYVGLFNEPNSKKFQYGIIIAGWNNSEVKVFKNGSWAKEVISAPARITNPKQINKFAIMFNAGKATVAVIINSHLVLTLYDPNYNASQAQWISFSQYGENVIIDHVEVDYCKAAVISGLIGEGEE